MRAERPEANADGVPAGRVQLHRGNLVGFLDRRSLKPGVPGFARTLARFEE
jgi:hypothetical protein